MSQLSFISPGDLINLEVLSDRSFFDELSDIFFLAGSDLCDAADERPLPSGNPCVLVLSVVPFEIGPIRLALFVLMPSSRARWCFFGGNHVDLLRRSLEGH